MCVIPMYNDNIRLNYLFKYMKCRFVCDGDSRASGAIGGEGGGGGGSRKIRENRVVTGNTADSRDRRVFGGPLQNDQPAQ